MKVGDLVRPKSSKYKTGAPIVEYDWIGIVLDFTRDYYGLQNQLIEKGNSPIVYWNEVFHSEIELPEQLEGISSNTSHRSREDQIDH